MKLDADILTGNFKKGSHRPASDLSARGRVQLRQRPVAYFWCYATVGPRRRSPRQRVARMLRFCPAPEIAEPVVNVRHGSINVVPAAIGLKTTDPPWRLEQWLHHKFAGRTRRRDASLSASKSSQKCHERPASCVLCFSVTLEPPALLLSTEQLPHQPMWTCSVLSSLGDLAGCSLPLAAQLTSGELWAVVVARFRKLASVQLSSIVTSHLR